MDSLIQIAQLLAQHNRQKIPVPIPRRIVYVVNQGLGYANNNYAVRTQRIAKALYHQGFEILCLLLPGRPLGQGIPSEGIPYQQIVEGVRYLHGNWQNGCQPNNEYEHLRSSVELLVEFFRVFRPQIVLAASDYKVGLPAWVTAERFGMPFYNEFRGFLEIYRSVHEPGYEHTTEFKAQAERDTFVAKQAQKIFALTNPIKLELGRRGADMAKIDVVADGFNEHPAIRQADPEIKHKLGIDDEDKVIGYVASFKSCERLDILLEACEYLVERGEKIKLLLVGSELPVMVDQCWVIQVGQEAYNVIGEYYALIDVAVIPGNKLPLCEFMAPVKVVEALAYGKRIVVSDIDPLAEYAENNKNVFKYPAEESKGLMKVLQRALEMPVPKYVEPVLMKTCIEPMAKVLREESGEPVLVNYGEKASKTNESIGREYNGISELATDIKWEECPIKEYEIFTLSGSLIAERLRSGKIVLLLHAIDSEGNALDFSSYGCLWSENYNHWFKYLYPNDKEGNLFQFKNGKRGLKLKFSLVKLSRDPQEKIFLRNKKIEVTKTNIIESSLQKFLMNNPILEEVENLLYADITLNYIDGSSIWLASMASILSHKRKTILLLKENVKNFEIYNSLKSIPKLIIIQPMDFLGDEKICLEVDVSIQCLRIMDNYLPLIKNVVVRGLLVATELHKTRQFKYRSYVYLTDFYSYDKNELTISEEQRIAVKILSRQAPHFIVQTLEIKSKLRELAGFDINTTLIPPLLPEIHFCKYRPLDNKEFKIIYAGKITPAWGVIELLDWTKALIEKGFNIKLTIISNKISSPGSDGKKFKESIFRKFDEIGVKYIPGLPRDQVLQLLTSADFVWCYRPRELEESVLELSTKLVEAVASGARALNYPTQRHKKLLGEDYPFFITTLADFESLLKKTQELSRFDTKKLSQKIIDVHSIKNAVITLEEVLNAAKTKATKIVFAGHDRKFIDSYYSYLKSNGFPARFDEWEWGSPGHERRSELFLHWSDKIFCEWGLANAVWYSNHNVLKKPLFIRIHLQEINEIAKKFGSRIKQDNVAQYIVVSERVRKEAEVMFGWTRNKSVCVPNFVLDDEFVIPKNKLTRKNRKIRIGMVGIIPQRKRFDRAIDLLLMLREYGIDAELWVKGPRPEECEFMHSVNRAPEMEYYNACYYKIESNPLIKDKVTFVPWGNDMPLWYEDIDYILSPSDFESFHYALADGVLSGCAPIVWPWEEANMVYEESWCVSDVEDAFDRISTDRKMTKKKRYIVLNSNRKYISDNYGCNRIYEKLNSIITAEQNKCNYKVYDREANLLFDRAG